MLAFFTVVHVLLCVFMIFVILLQPGKDAGMGAALGGGAATSAFGGRGAVTFLSKLTAACAGLFFLTSLGLSFVGVRGSVTSGLTTKPPTPVSAPASGAAPAGTAAPGATGAAPATDAEPALAKDAPPVPASPAPAQK